MATTADVLLDAFGRVRDTVHEVLGGTPEDHLAEVPAEGTNTIAWLAWHLTRVMDEHVSDAFGTDAVWTSQGWRDRFGLPFSARATGYGMTFDEVLQVRASPENLRGYFDATFEVAVAAIGAVTDSDLDRIVDERWDPPVTLAVRLVSVVDDCLQHAGQAAYARGILTR